jgi:hypothetical protein
MYTLTTIRKGERVAIWERNGDVRVVDGPRRLWLRGATVQPVPRFTAGPGQYLVVRFKDGQATHVPGPAAVWLDPLEHDAIAVHPAIAIDANEAVVVYRREAPAVTRRIERGPLLFVPGANEWLHEFSWHGADPADRRRKIPHALKFTRLRVIPDQTYFDIEDVRTADDALLTIKLMIFFELTDLERMLDQTHDPVADFINAVTADVMEFAAGLPFEQFKERTARLNELATYTQLVQRAARIGYAINKVVYRGYQAGAKLQSMHDGAIEARTRLRLEAETEEQAQALADLKLERERDRAAQRQQMAEAEAGHRIRLERAAHDERLRRRQAERDARRAARQRDGEMAMQQRTAIDSARLAFLRGMEQMNIDLTRYLVARQRSPDRLVRIDGGNGAQLHVHEN